MAKKLAVINQSKFLGVTLESHLGWSAHSNKIIPFVKVFARCQNLLSENDKRTLYFSLIHPHVSFFCNVWGHCPAQQLERLSIIHKRVLKTLFNLPPQTGSAQLFKSLSNTAARFNS